MITTRRKLMGLLVAGTALGGLAACTKVTSGGSTTYTLNLTKVISESQAIIAAVQGALVIPAVIAMLGTQIAAVQAALELAQTALGEIETMTGGTVSATIDTSKAQALVQSLLGDLQTALGYVKAVLPSLPPAQANSVGTAVGGALALIPIVEMAAGLVGATQAEPMMNETTAHSQAMSLGPYHPPVN